MFRHSFTKSEAAARLGLGYRRVGELIATGELKAHLVGHDGRGRRLRITAQAIAAYRRRRPRKWARR